MNSYFSYFIIFLMGLMAACQPNVQPSPQANDYFHVKTADAFLPVWVRGNTSSNKILLYIAGGPGGSGIDIAKVDYQRWKETLEQDYAIAYYDQRGTGNNQGTFDLSSVTLSQYTSDIQQIVQLLRDQYKEAEIYLMGHSFGGYLVYHYLHEYGQEELVAGSIALNAPASTDADPERWSYRRSYLQGIAQELVAHPEDSSHWQSALSWLEAYPEIATDEEKRQWNQFVEVAVVEADRPITISEVLGVVFFSPYNYFSAYAYGKLEQVEQQMFQEGYQSRMIEKLDRIDQRILLMTGRFDDIAPPEEMTVILDQLSSTDKELIIIPDAGHDLALDQPALFQTAIQGFVR